MMGRICSHVVIKSDSQLVQITETTEYTVNLDYPMQLYAGKLPSQTGDLPHLAHEHPLTSPRRVLNIGLVSESDYEGYLEITQKLTIISSSFDSTDRGTSSTHIAPMLTLLASEGQVSATCE